MPKQMNLVNCYVRCRDGKVRICASPEANDRAVRDMLDDDELYYTMCVRTDAKTHEELKKLKEQIEADERLMAYCKMLYSLRECRRNADYIKKNYTPDKRGRYDIEE